jgi:hypothetical protein
MISLPASIGCAQTENLTTDYPAPQVSPSITSPVIERLDPPEYSTRIDVVEAEGTHVCEEPTDEVLSWLNANLSFRIREQVAGELGTGDAVMVSVGPGNNPDEYWWIVAVRDINVDTRQPRDRTFLTNTPSEEQPSGQTWIQVRPHINGVGPNGERDGWGFVRWPEERILKGQQAENFALACLSNS